MTQGGLESSFKQHGYHIRDQMLEMGQTLEDLDVVILQGMS